MDNGTKDFIEEDNKYHLKIIYNNNIIEDDFAYGSISNSQYLGGFKMFKNEEFSINDGQFEVVLIKATKNKAELLKTYTGLINQKRDKNVLFFKTSNLKIETSGQMQWSLDGEEEDTIGNNKKKNIQNNINILTMK